MTEQAQHHIPTPTETAWYAIFTNDATNAKRILESAPGIVEVFVPMYHVAHSADNQLKAKYTVSSYLFIRGSVNSILKALEERPEMSLERNSLLSSRLDSYIPDDDMMRFRLYSEEQLQLERLHKPYAAYANNDFVRILTGPLAGTQGFIMKTHGDNKLIVKIGNLPIAISNARQFSLEVIANTKSRQTEYVRIYQLQDYFGVRLRTLEVCDERYTDEILREVLADLHSIDQLPTTSNRKCGTLEDTAFSTLANNLRHQTQLTDVEKGKLAFLETFIRTSKDSKASAEQKAVECTWLCDLMRYVFSKNAVGDLERILPDRPLRAFLTPPYPKLPNQQKLAKVKHAQFEEWIVSTTMDEGEYDAETGTTSTKQIPAHAHLAIRKEADGTIILFSNWTHFCDELEHAPAIDRERLKANLQKFKLDYFYRLVCRQDKTVHFHTDQATSVKGLAITLPPNSTEADLQQAAGRLIDSGKRLCKELLESTNLKNWRQKIYTAYIPYLNGYF